jgi:hypothetical protein
MPKVSDMASHLASHGWKYIVIDIQWYEPNGTGFSSRKDAKLSMVAWVTRHPTIHYTCNS